jgi:hypothetical protein
VSVWFYSLIILHWCSLFRVSRLSFSCKAYNKWYLYNWAEI